MNTLIILYKTTSSIHNHGNEVEKAATTKNQCFRTAEELAKVHVALADHFITVRRETIREIQNGSTVTAIHKTSHGDAFFHGANENPEQIIVANLTMLLKVHRNQRLVVTIFFVAC
jgi:hypothetical protein